MAEGTREESGQGNRAKEKSRDHLLAWMVVVGILIVLICALLTDPVANWLTSFANWLFSRVAFTHGEIWEIGAIVWSVAFLFYYNKKLQSTGDFDVDKTIMSITYLGVLLPALVAIVLLVTHCDYRLHFLCVSVIAVSFALADRIKSEKDILEDTQQRFKESLYVGDYPLVIGFIVLWIYVFMHDKHEEALSTFLAGAISFQLISSNALFVMSQGGFIRGIWVPRGEPGSANKSSKGQSA
jgi:hypothetical protein